MRSLIAVPAAALAVASCGYGYGPPPPPPPPSPYAQAALSEALAGRVEGPTLSCVSSRQLRGNRSIGEGVILFRGSSRNTVYVNRPPAGCPEIRPGRALRTRTPSTRLCAGDIVEVFDPVHRMGYGGCGLGYFTEYRRIR